MMVDRQYISHTFDKLKPHIRRTSLVYSKALSALSGAKVFLKMEQEQLSGSFKMRGVLAKMFSLSKHELKRPLVAASTGNHAAAFALASKMFHFSGTLFLPENVNEAKRNALGNHKLQLKFFGHFSAVTEARARQFAHAVNGVLVHPYNDWHIIGGQGTLGVEILGQCPELDTVLVPLGGGGLASGLALYFKDDPKVQIRACQPKNAPEMYQSIKAGEIVPPSQLPTIADASAGGLEADALTFGVCQKYLSGIDLLSEEAIMEAVWYLWKEHRLLVEPTAALPVAAIMKNKGYQGKTVVLVLTGKKIAPIVWEKIQHSYGENTD